MSKRAFVHEPTVKVIDTEFPEHIWAELGGETVAYVRERTCRNLATPEDVDDSPFTCSECGARSSYGDGTFHIGESFMLNGNLMLADAWHAWRHCPNCGARVEGEK